MNRRNFITKALAGIAAIPILGKLAEAPIFGAAIQTHVDPEPFSPIEYTAHFTDGRVYEITKWKINSNGSASIQFGKRIDPVSSASSSTKV